MRDMPSDPTELDYSFHDAFWYWDKKAQEYKFMSRGIRFFQAYKDYKNRKPEERFCTTWVAPDYEGVTGEKAVEVTKICIEQSLRALTRLTEMPKVEDKYIADVVALWHTAGPKATAVKPGTEYGDRKPDEDDDLDDDFKEEE